MPRALCPENVTSLNLMTSGIRWNMCLSSSAKLLTNPRCCSWYCCLWTTVCPRFMEGQGERWGWKDLEGKRRGKKDKRSTNRVLAGVACGVSKREPSLAILSKTTLDLYFWARRNTDYFADQHSLLKKRKKKTQIYRCWYCWISILSMIPLLLWVVK